MIEKTRKTVLKRAKQAKKYGRRNRISTYGYRDMDPAYPCCPMSYFSARKSPYQNVRRLDHI